MRVLFQSALAEAAADDDLGDRVHVVLDLQLFGRFGPVCRHAFVGLAAEDEQVRLPADLQRIGPQLLAPGQLVIAEVPWRFPLEIAVEGHQVPDDQFAHGVLP